MSDEQTLRWRWRVAVAASDLPPPARLVLHTLALSMDCDGSNCFPSLARLTRDTGLCRRSIVKHIERAREDGWIRVLRRKNRAGNWTSSTYFPTIAPGGGRAGDAPPLTLVGGRAGDALGVGQEMHPTTLTDYDTYSVSPPFGDLGSAPDGKIEARSPENATSERADSSDGSAGKERAAGLPENSAPDVSAGKTPAADAEPEGFLDFWKLWPKSVDKKDARRAWRAAIKVADLETIMAGASAYVDMVQRERRQKRHIKGPAAWLRAEKWDDDLSGHDGPPADADADREAETRRRMAEIRDAAR